MCRVGVGVEDAWLTLIAGWILLLVPAVLLPVLDLPRCFWILVLVPSWWLLHNLYCGELSLVYYFRGILEAPGGRSELQMGDQECFCCPN